MLQLKNIKKNYYVGEQVIEALKGITLDFRKCEFVSVLGPSGCGKTTMMNVVGGLDKFTSGDILINGKSTKDFKDADWDNYRNKKVGFVFQNYNLISHLSVVANVELALTLSGVSVEERHKRAKEALENVGLQDQMYKNPNQLSGGQMQRVAIARALVNSPEILLADEPTGALDTKTSRQILDILKEISKDRLVIMVTHNGDLAEKYSTRIIRMLDGVITEDSDPYESERDSKYKSNVEQIRAAEQVHGENKRNKTVKKVKDRTSMSFFTALSLSFKNLFTKKTRTILTAVAGSIGIIGIALIMSVQNGMNLYIEKMQTDALSSYPITISTGAFDMTQIMAIMQGQANEQDKETHPDDEKIFLRESLKPSDIMHQNIINKGFVDHLQTNLKSEWYNDISYLTGVRFDVFGKTNYERIKTTTVSELSQQESNYWYQLPSSNFVSSQYDEIAGRMPLAGDAGKYEIVLIVNEYNELSDLVIKALQLKTSDGQTEFNFSDIVGREYKILTANEMYNESANTFAERTGTALQAVVDGAHTLKVVGILRQNKDTSMGVLSSGVGYTKELAEWMISENMQSNIVQWMNKAENENKNPFGTSTSFNWEQTLRRLGGTDIPNEINIYPVDFDSKELIKGVISDYNALMEADGKDDHIIKYTDMLAVMGSMLTSLVDVISIVLIAFTSISLVVSSIMIAIITYVSVLERTKEIGILRSIGARKRDITRVFNAETFIIGLTAGVIGVGVALLLTIPINAIVGSLAGVYGIANLAIGGIFLLIGISVVLTLISGFVPSKIAARKDPVTALRTE